MDPTEQEVRAAEEQLRLAMLANDVAALKNLLHDDLTFTAIDGDIVQKDDDLAAHAAKKLALSKLELFDLTVSVNAGVAHTSVRAVMTGTFEGKPADGSYKYTRSWKKQDGRWQVIAGRVTPLK